MEVRVQHPRLRQLYAYWDDKRGDRPAPSKAEIDPVDIPHLLGHIFIYDVEQSPRDYVMRLFGTALTELFGRDVTGNRFAEIFPEEINDPTIREEYDAVVDRWTPIAACRDARWSQKEHIRYERLLMPLSSDGRVVDRLLGGAYRLS